jgi:single-stranded-DNA-specific exonuclease
VKKRLERRVLDPSIYERLVSEGWDPVLSRIIAARPMPPAGVNSCLFPKLSDLDSPSLMKDMDKAVDRLIEVIQSPEASIGIETDHDCDGQTSHAVIYAALTEIFGVDPSRIRSYIGHRMNEGYGLSVSLMNRILADERRPSLVITADNGSSDETQIAVLKAAGIDVIVTDHHHLPEEGPPKSAYAVLNPSREDCEFPDSLIAGCMVAWLFMARTRARLIERKILPESTESLKSLLDFVAVGTVADCVSMARSVNNRAVVKYGLKLINELKRPCWAAISQLKNGAKITTEDLGFLIGPLLNSDGRLSDAFGSVNFLLSTHLSEAEPWVKALSEQNQRRKTIQKEITEEALKIGASQVSEGRASLVIALNKGHAGVHGISASRIKDQFGRPTILFSAKAHEPDFLSGSARSIDGVHLRNALARVKDFSSDVMMKFGGHAGAAGLMIHKDKLSDFSVLFEKAILEQVSFDCLGPVVLTDGPLPSDYFSLDFLEKLSVLEPLGREFDSPVFEGIFSIRQLKWMGADQTHLSLQLSIVNQGYPSYRAVWFNAEKEAKGFEVGQMIHAAFSLTLSEFRANRELNLRIVHGTLATFEDEGVSDVVQKSTEF